MPASLPVWMGDLHALYPPPVVGMIVTIAAVVAGAAVGLERGRREKPAGLRTMMLISLGSCIFTQAGMLLAGSTGDRARVAAQVVTGIGFLGAGAIIHAPGMVVGFTTGAAIWAMAAIGVVMGSGYVLAGAFFTFLTLATLAAERTLEQLLYGACVFSLFRGKFDLDRGKTRLLIQGILDEHQVPEEYVQFGSEAEGMGSVTIRVCTRHRHHRAYASQIAGLPTVREVRESPLPASG